MATHRPQEIEGAHEGRHLAPLEQVEFHDPFAGFAGVQILGDPEQGVQVAQPTLALLDVRLDQIAARAGARVPLVALLQLGGDELRPRPLDHLVAETAL